MGKPSKRLPCIGNRSIKSPGLPGGKQRYVNELREFKKAYALASATVEADKIREKVEFFKAVNVQLGKRTLVVHRCDDAEIAIRQIVSRAVPSERVADIFEVAGLLRPAISLLSEEFLAEIQNMRLRNLAV